MADLLESGIKLLILVCSIGVGAACIVAWCQIAKRLGYDLYAGAPLSPDLRHVT